MKLTGHAKRLGMHTTHTMHRHEEIYYLPVSPTKFIDSHVHFPSTLSLQLLPKGICFLHHCRIELLRVGFSDYSGPSMGATTSVVGIKLKQVFRVKKLVGLPPQLELLADSVTSQVHDNLFKLAHAESIGMHIASLMQGHTDTNRLCNYFLLSFAHLELHQTILLFIPSHIVCFLLEDRNTIRRY